MATLINRIQRAILGSAGPDKVRGLLNELAIPAGGSGGTIREVRRGVLRPISDEAILRDALANIGLTGGGGGGGNQALSSIRTAILHNLVDSETTLRDGLDGLLAPGDLAEGGGGGGSYAADAVHSDGSAKLMSADVLTGVSSSSTGFMITWVKPGLIVGASLLKESDDYAVIRFASPSGEPPYEDSFLHIEFGDEPYSNYITLNSDNAILLDQWNSILLAWDTNYAAGSRRIAIYVNDELVSYTTGDDEGDAFEVFWGSDSVWVLLEQVSHPAYDFSDTGLWIGSSIVEAGGIISEVNRRKFVTADNKPVDPSNWPASPVVKFVGDASTFATNQGSGGEFALTNGTLTDADNSPSD